MSEALTSLLAPEGAEFVRITIRNEAGAVIGGTELAIADTDRIDIDFPGMPTAGVRPSGPFVRPISDEDFVDWKYAPIEDRTSKLAELFDAMLTGKTVRVPNILRDGMIRGHIRQIGFAGVVHVSTDEQNVGSAPISYEPGQVEVWP